MRKVLLIDKSGKETDKEKLACAKFIDNEETGKKGYYLKYSYLGLFHPKLSQVEIARNKWRFVRVNEEKFNLYLKFLKTRNEITYRKLDRG